MHVSPAQRRFFLAAGVAAALLCGWLPRAACADDVLHAAIGAPGRSAKFIGRDATRHPQQELEFFGIRPDATIVEVRPGGGYWTEILAPYLSSGGTYVVALPVDAGDEHEAASFHTKFDGKPGYTGVNVATLDKGKNTLAPESADFMLTFRNVHNWMYGGYADEIFADFYKALKPGGILGVEEHRGLDTVPQDPKADNGYVRQDYAIALAKKAGFELVGTSELNANPKDTKNWPQGVWTLPPSFALKDVDHAKYAAIGEADNFILKFRKPAK